MEGFYYKDKLITEHSQLPEEVVGFVYRIIYEDNTEYIGKKLIKSYRRLKPTKKQLAIRKNYKRVELKNLPFKKYEGSNKTDKKVKRKEIIQLATSKQLLSYYENYYLYSLKVLEDSKYLNNNISGKFYRSIFKD